MRRTQEPRVVLDGDTAVIGTAHRRQVVRERRLLQQRARRGVRVGLTGQRLRLAARLWQNSKMSQN